MVYLGHFPADHPDHPFRKARAISRPKQHSASERYSQKGGHSEGRTLPPQIAKLAPKRENYPDQESFEEAKAFFLHRFKTPAR
jgi:hypothetical protein